ncbi:MAG: type II toxin-antitoxin system RelB/DinJ family antitoxin [bacterium]
MNKTATVRARIEPDLKKEVENLFRELGISTTEAINIFYHQVKLRRGLPFPVVIPNETTKEVFEDTDADKNVIHCSNINEMFEKLKI